MQWDPDHDIYGEKQERKAIQLGIKGDLLVKFNETMIDSIEDITPYVKAQKELIDKTYNTELEIPKEWEYIPESEELRRIIGL